MPFDSETKARMFIKSGRLCCLCLKQCGTNMEAAHIIDEHKGGNNDEDNGIPTCFDCHQEMGGYDPKHPKGNKFTPAELKARRNRVYDLVQSGAIYAQIVASQARKNIKKGKIANLPADPTPPVPSAEGKAFADQLLNQGEKADSPARKLQILTEDDRAYVIDELLKQVPAKATALPVLSMIATSKLISDQERCLILENMTRKVSLFGDLESKIELLRSVPEAALLAISEEVRSSLFDDLIRIVNRDQYDEVNKLVPVLVGHTLDIPSELRGDYIIALLNQSQSDSWKGAPAARAVLRRLPEEVVKDGIHRLDRDYLYWKGQKKDIKNFVEFYHGLAKGKQKRLFSDLLELSYVKFCLKYAPTDD